jgi:hypothetical protein
MKKTLLVLAMVVVFIITIFRPVQLVAEEKEKLSDVSIALSSKVWSGYTYQTGAMASRHLDSQTDLFVFFPKSGFYVDLWQAADLDNTKTSTNHGWETDYTIGWRGKLQGFGVNAGISYFDLAPLANSKGDFVMPYLEVDRTFCIFKDNNLIPFGRLEYYFPVSGHGLQNGIRGYLGIKDIWKPLAKYPKLTLSQRFAGLYDGGVGGVKYGAVVQYENVFSYKVSKFFSIEPLAIVARTPITHVPGRKTEGVFGTGVTFYLSK